MRVNDTQVEQAVVYTRQPHNKLGDKARDKPLLLDTLLLKRMENVHGGLHRWQLTMSLRDERSFVVLVTVVRLRS